MSWSWICFLGFSSRSVLMAPDSEIFHSNSVQCKTRVMNVGKQTGESPPLAPQVIFPYHPTTTTPGPSSPSFLPRSKLLPCLPHLLQPSPPFPIFSAGTGLSSGHKGQGTALHPSVTSPVPPWSPYNQEVMETRGDGYRAAALEETLPVKVNSNLLLKAEGMFAHLLPVKEYCSYITAAPIIYWAHHSQKRQGINITKGKKIAQISFTHLNYRYFPGMYLVNRIHPFVSTSHIKY